MTVGCSLYRFYDADDRLLYVGITSRGPGRWTEHEEHRAWWERVARTSVEHFPDRVTASAAERAAIHDEKPLHNVRHTTTRTPTALGRRRKNGTGTLHHRSDTGQWMVIVRLDSGRKVYRKFAHEDDARLFLAVTEYRHSATADTRRKAIEVLEAGSSWDPHRD